MSFADDDVKDDVNDSVDNIDSDNDKPPEETPEQEIERLKAEKVKWEEDRQKFNQEKSHLGVKFQELVRNQELSAGTISNMKSEIDSLKAPKQDPEFRDLNDPAVADRWFEDKVNQRINKDNTAQKEYSNQYDRDIRKLVEDEGMDAEEKEAVYAKLETQKDNVFNDSARDAEHNLREAQRLYYKEKLSGSATKNLNLKKEKPVGTGVGGGGTQEGTKKKPPESPELVKLREAMSRAKELRGWQPPVKT